jgi:hypothetical protein
MHDTSSGKAQHSPGIHPSIPAFIKTLTAQDKVVDLHATDRVIVIVFVFPLVLGLVAIAIVVAIALALLIAVVFQAVPDVTGTACVIAI